MHHPTPGFAFPGALRRGLFILAFALSHPPPMSTGLVYHDAFLEHDTGPTHPERPDRLRAVMDALDKHHLLADLHRLDIAPATDADFETLHDRRYVRRVIHAAETGEPFVDSPECPLSPGTLEAIRLATGGVLAAVDAVMAGEVGNAFCAVRPPGHHAEADRATGFCYFNHAALAAERLLRVHGLSRVAIIDFDVHHGNGTQHLFEARGDVLFCSIHEHPMHLYPGTGFAHERGEGAGKNLTVNVPLDPGAGDREFRHALVYKVMPALNAFKPEFVLVSAGFDAARDDPLAHLEYTPEAFRWATGFIKKQAERHCHGRLVSILEGGYDLRSLSECVCLHVGALMRGADVDGTMAMKAGL